MGLRLLHPFLRPQNVQTGSPTRLQGRKNCRRNIPPPTPSCRDSSFPRGEYHEDFFDPRTPLDACFSILPSHVSIFSKHLHPPTLVLSPPRPLCDRTVPQFFNDVVHALGGRFDRSRTGRAAQAAIAGPIPSIKIEINEGNVLKFNVLPNIDLRPIQQRMDPYVCSGRKSCFELVPELRGLIAEIPIAVFVAGREVPFLSPRA